MTAVKMNLDHPLLPELKREFPDAGLFVTEFRGETTIVVPKARCHDVLTFMHRDSRFAFDFLFNCLA